MCNRFKLTQSLDQIALRFQVEEFIGEFMPSYNICPCMDVSIITEWDGVRTLRQARWGIVPPWASDPNSGPKPTNAKTEGIASNGLWGNIVKKWRCLIPADGFFEWSGAKPPKTKHYIHIDEEEAFAFAGLFSIWKPPGGGPKLVTCAIVTTSPNELMWSENGDGPRIHHRMPVILDPEDEAAWINPRSPLQDVLTCLKPYPANAMDSYPVISTKSDGPEVLEALRTL